MIMKKYVLLIVIFTGCVQPPQKGVRIGTTEDSFTLRIGWEEYLSESSVSFDQIERDHIVGIWLAFRGGYKVEGNIIKGMNLVIPNRVQFTKDSVVRSLDSPWNPYDIHANRILITEGVKLDTGIINYISKDSMTITWKYIPPQYKEDSDKYTNPKKTYYTRYLYSREK
jgi:hypothetical protein